MTKKILTLCVIHKDFHVFLGLKKRGFGMGRWNGFGGKVMEGESIEEAAYRELREEAGIEAKALQKVGQLCFEFKGDPVALEVHVFRGSDFDGEPFESDEMKPEWFSVSTIPFEKMWPDDRHWLPLLLAGKKFKGTFLFDGQDTITDIDLKEVKEV